MAESSEHADCLSPANPVGCFLIPIEFSGEPYDLNTVPCWRTQTAACPGKYCSRDYHLMQDYIDMPETDKASVDGQG